MVRTPARRGLLFSSLLVLAACDGANTSLADLPGLRVQLSATGPLEYLDDELHPSRAEVTIGYNESMFRDGHGGDCATISTDTEGRLDGVALEVVDQGAYHEDEGGSGCSFPTLEGDFLFQPGAAHTLVVGDETVTVTAEYAPNAMEPPIAVLRSHADWTFRAGDQVVVRWSRPADLTPLEPTFRLGFYLRTAGSPNHFDMPFQVVGDELHFQFPTTLPVDGEGDMKFEATENRGPSVSCQGAVACTFQVQRRYVRRSFVE